MAIVPFYDPAVDDSVMEGEFKTAPEEKAEAPSVISIQFIATLAGVNTSAKPASFDIDGAAKIAFETDETQTPNVVALLALKRARLIVTVEVDQSVTGQAAPETGTKRRRSKKVTKVA